jgi:AraC-like DNA-binding protein
MTLDYEALLLPRLLNLGAVRVAESSVFPLPMVNGEPIRHMGAENIELYLALIGKLHVPYADRTVAIEPGEFVLLGTSQPLTDQPAQPKPGSTRGIAVSIPRGLLPLSGRTIDLLVARPFPGHDGIGRLVIGFLTDLLAQGTHKPADAVRIGAALLDLITAMLTHQLEASALSAGNASPVESPSGILLTDIQSFILRNLNDPALTPDTIATAHHISLSHLYRLFRKQGRTVSAWIRQQRLERCRRDLVDPAQGATPIHAIARHWGFNHPADFSRAFRTTYDISPSEYRSLASI